MGAARAATCIVSIVLLAAMPALLARCHVEPLLDAADEMRRRAA